MKITYVLPFLALSLLAGCGSDGTVRPPPTRIRVFDAAPNYEVIFFRREQRVEAQVELGTGTAKSFDSGPYDFSIEYTSPGSIAPVRAETLSLDLSPDLDYLFIPVSPAGQLQTLVISVPEPPPSETLGRYTFAHAHPTFGAFDVYMVDTATVTDCDFGSALPQGSLSYGTTAITFSLAPAVYRLCLTAPGDPSTIRYQSNDFPGGAAGSDLAFIAYDEGERTTSDLTLSIIGTSAAILNEAGADARVRAIQAVDDGLDRNVFRNDETTPLYPAPLAAGVLSDYASVSSPAFSDLKLVPIGGGDPEASISLAPLSSHAYTVVYAGDTTDGINATLMAEDTRPFVGQASARFIHAAGMHDTVEIFVRPPGTDLTNSIPNAGFSSAPGVSPRFPFVPGDYEITVRDILTKAVLAGPVPVTLEDGGVYGVMTLNNPADPATVTIQYIYDLAP